MKKNKEDEHNEWIIVIFLIVITIGWFATMEHLHKMNRQNPVIFNEAQ